jgi:hypothetical protein
MATITTIAHTDRPIQHRFVALFIGFDFIRLSKSGRNSKVTTTR